MSALAEEYREFRQRGGVIRNSDRTRLVFRGADRVRFLNGQLTANIAAGKVPSIIPACVTTAKGKLCADVFVTLREDAVVVDSDPAHAESLQARFERYIVADDVDIQNLSRGIDCSHLAGVALDSVAAELRARLLPVNRFGAQGFDFQPTELSDGADGGWLEFSANFPVPSSDLLDLIRIEHGVPRWGFELDENTLPAEAGLDRTHVDFKKGCYIGQEVISRVKSVGHVNRELRGFLADGAIEKGARLFTPDAPEKDLGTITSTAFSFTLDRHIALGYLRRGSPQDGLLAANASAPDAPVRVTLHPLPFIS